MSSSGSSHHLSSDSHLLLNPFWWALTTSHAAFSHGRGLARRYPADVIPFGGLATETAEALNDLAVLLKPGESIHVTGERVAGTERLQKMDEIAGWQMSISPKSVKQLLEAIPPSPVVRPLNSNRAAEHMVALTSIAFPSFFRPRSHVLGRYFGIYEGESLVAMAGERLSMPGLCEISAVCTHPERIGRGHAAALVRHIVRLHASEGIQSFLHVSGANERAIALYNRLGFERTRPMRFNLFSRTACP